MSRTSATDEPGAPRGTITLARLWGVPVRIHSSFVLLAVGFSAWRYHRGGLWEAVDGLIIGTMLFGSVLLHELGHARAGRSFGVSTRDVTLYPFGGVAAMKLPPNDSSAELWIALAGPAVNVALAALGGLLFAARVPLAHEMVLPFIGINVGMAVFNLAPAYPMDGGRVLRAWLAERRGLIPDTQTALFVSRLIAWACLAASLRGSPPLALAGGFLLLVTGGERKRWDLAAQRAASLAAWRGQTLRAPRGGPFGWRERGLWLHPRFGRARRRAY